MATVNEKEVFDSTLDNTSVNQGEASCGNSNPTIGVSEQLSESIPPQPSGKTSEKENNLVCLQKTLEESSLNELCATVAEDHDPLKNKSMDVQKDSNLVKQKRLSLENSNNVTGVVELSTPSENGEIGKALVDNLEDSEQDDCEEDVMTGSYGEISLDRELLNCDKNSDSISSKEDEHFLLEETKVANNGCRVKKRPNSLVLTQNISNLETCGQDSHQVDRSQQTSEGRTTSAEISPSFSSEEFAVHSSGRARTGSDTSGLSELQGTLTIDGDMVTFVAEDLQEKIKMSSPVSRWTDSSFPNSRSSTPSLYRQALQPNLHIVDPTVLTDLENHAKKVATCVDTMLENLSETLQCISSLTVDCMQTYESSVCKTCDAVDLNIKAVYQLMAKCEELSNAMGPLYKMSSDIKHIKRVLEQLEYFVEHKS